MERNKVIHINMVNFWAKIYYSSVSTVYWLSKNKLLQAKYELNPKEEQITKVYFTLETVKKSFSMYFTSLISSFVADTKFQHSILKESF